MENVLKTIRAPLKEPLVKIYYHVYPVIPVMNGTRLWTHTQNIYADGRAGVLFGLTMIAMITLAMESLTHHVLRVQHGLEWEARPLQSPVRWEIGPLLQ